MRRMYSSFAACQEVRRRATPATLGAEAVRYATDTSPPAQGAVGSRQVARLVESACIAQRRYLSQVGPLVRAELAQPNRCVGAISGAELVSRVRQVPRDSVVAERQPVRYLAIRQALTR